MHTRYSIGMVWENVYTVGVWDGWVFVYIYEWCGNDEEWTETFFIFYVLTINVYGIYVRLYIHSLCYYEMGGMNWGGLNRKWNWSDKKEIRFAGDTVKLCQEKCFKKNTEICGFCGFVYTAL